MSQGFSYTKASAANGICTIPQDIFPVIVCLKNFVLYCIDKTLGFSKKGHQNEASEKRQYLQAHLSSESMEVSIMNCLLFHAVLRFSIFNISGAFQFYTQRSKADDNIFVYLNVFENISECYISPDNVIFGSLACPYRYVRGGYTAQQKMILDNAFYMLSSLFWLFYLKRLIRAETTEVCQRCTNQM